MSLPGLESYIFAGTRWHAVQQYNIRCYRQKNCANLQVEVHHALRGVCDDQVLGVVAAGPPRVLMP